MQVSLNKKIFVNKFRSTLHLTAKDKSLFALTRLPVSQDSYEQLAKPSLGILPLIGWAHWPQSYDEHEIFSCDLRIGQEHHQRAASLNDWFQFALSPV